jgi:hypothetical protein
VSLLFIVHGTGAAVLVAVGLMLAAVGSLLVGVLAVVAGGAWLTHSLRRL